MIPWDTSYVGGVSQVVLGLANSLKLQGAYEPLIIVQDWNATSARIETRDGIRHIFVRMRGPAEKADRSLKKIPRALLAQLERRRFARQLKAHNVQILNFHYPTFAAERYVDQECVVAGVRLKVIFSLHGTDMVGAAREGPHYRRRYAEMLARGDACVVVSQAFAKLVAYDLAPELAGKLTLIHNGVSPGALQNGASTVVPLPSRYILNVGTFDEIKGQRYLVEAFAHIASDYPDLDLVFAGRSAAALEDLRQQIALLSLDNRVRLLLDIPHASVGSLFASATVFCLSSLAESFGIVVLEAGVFGLPVVATAVGGVPEVLRDSRDGVLVRAGSAPELAAALRALLDAPAWAATLGASLRDRVHREFSWELTTAQYIALAKSL